MELTCTVQTLKDGTAGVDADDYPGARGAWAAGGRRGRTADDGEGAVRGPLKNFRAASSSAGGRGRRGRKHRGRRDGDSEYSGEGSSADDSEGSKVGVVLVWKG